MEQLFRTHREAEARRDYDTVMDTFTADCHLETVALGLRSEGREAVRAAFVGYFTAFPDLKPEDQVVAFGDDAMVSWGFLRGTSGVTGWASRLRVDPSRFRSRTLPGSRVI
jgi:hypothetical protein